MPSQATPSRLTRRRLLASLTLPALQACSPLLPPITTPASDARALLDAAATAHGLAALSGITDISVRYAGEWHALVGSLVPDLVDSGHRGGSEERLLLREHLTAQAHAGPAGRKQVVRRANSATQGTVQVWFDGAETRDADKRDAAALVADGYTLFLLGPMLLAAHRGPMQLAGPERITVDGRDHACDILRIGLAPGLGLSASDQIALYIDRDERLMRRVRFSLDGLDATRGAVAEVDTAAHVIRDGVRWPTRFHERLLRPLPIAVHDWRMTGLDLNRGLAVADIDGPAFTGRAAAPAAALA